MEHCPLRPVLNALIALPLLALSPAASRQSEPAPPSILLDGLYGDVAKAGIFKDFKQFADATPKRSPAEILAAYRRQHPSSPVALRRFVQDNFELGERDAVVPGPPPGLPLVEHIARLWPHLTRRTEDPPAFSSALPLPRPYVVPGGRFHELYYWDSYFTMLGFGPAEAGLRDDMIADFRHELHSYGHIPNGNRTYFLSRSQPPFFFAIVALTEPGAEARAYARFLPELKAEYTYWMRGAERAMPGNPVRNVVMMPDQSLLNRYWDERDAPRDESYPDDEAVAQKSGHNAAQTYRDLRAAAESGWDFSSRWFADHQSLQTVETTSIVPADLNSLLFGLERAISRGCATAQDKSCAEDFDRRAAQRRRGMQKYLWNGRWFDDYRWTDNTRRNNVSAAALYPLFFGVANDAQAHKTADMVRAQLLEGGGLVTTNRTTGQQWDAPNGWAPLQWIAVQGLRGYHQDGVARDIACRWLGTVARVYKTTGRLLEKYDVVSSLPGGGGEYPLQDGFGWTNGVTIALLKQYPDCSR